MLESQISQHERRETLRNDLKVRQQQEESRRVFADQSLPNQASTLHVFAEADAQTPRGRFSVVDTAYVVGSKSDVASAYPAAAAHQRDPVPKEEPLGYRIDELEPDHSPLAQEALEPSPLVQGSTSAPALEAPSPRDDVEPDAGARLYRRP